MEEWESAFGGGCKTGLHLAFRDGVARERVDSSDAKCCFDGLGDKGSLVGTAEQVRELALVNSTEMGVLILHNLLFPVFFHPRKTDNVQALKRVSTMGRISEEDDVVLPRTLDELDSIVRTVAVKQESSDSTLRLLPSLWFEDFFKPTTPDIAIGPSPI